MNLAADDIKQEAQRSRLLSLEGACLMVSIFWWENRFLRIPINHRAQPGKNVKQLEKQPVDGRGR